MSESPSEHTEPQTPPRYPREQDHPDGDTTASFSSPSASPSVSFRSFGRSPFSPLRHQISGLRPESSQSPQSNGVTHDYTDVIEDSKDVLIQRLNDLAAKLAAEEDVHGESVDSMHAKVDDLEQVLLHSLGSRPRRHKRNQSSLSLHGIEPDFDSGKSRPSWLKPHLSAVASTGLEVQGQEESAVVQGPPADTREHGTQTDSHYANLILSEAQKVQSALETVVGNLKARQEEQEHIHDLLITRAERAAQRIIYLDERVKELENERNEGEMEVLNLQIQLKAIEVQCLSYVPKDADPDLLESIETWKAEWSALKRQRARKRGEELAEESSPAPRGFRRQVLRSHTAG